MPKSEEEIRALISLCKREEVPYYIVGNGSNLLVSDAGYRGVIIAIGREMAVIEVHGCTIRAQAGALMSQMLRRHLSISLRDLSLRPVFRGRLAELRDECGSLRRRDERCD